MNYYFQQKLDLLHQIGSLLQSDSNKQEIKHYMSPRSNKEDTMQIIVSVLPSGRAFEGGPIHSCFKTRSNI